MVVHGYVHKEGGFHVSRCLELPVSSFGDSPAEARVNLEIAVRSFLEEANRAREMGLEVRVFRADFYWFKLALWAFRWHILQHRLDCAPQEALDTSGMRAFSTECKTLVA